MKTVLVIFLLVTTVAMGATPVAKKNLKKEPPQMAGFAMLPQKHTCQLSYEGCQASCKSTNGAGCAEECDSDCNVCALDFGEENASVCKK